ncbi:MAG: hypothetical protein AAF684_10525 [Pseudomonadota bacterium]
MLRSLTAGLVLCAAAGGAAAAPLCTDLGFAGLLANCNRGDIPEITLKTGEPLTEGPITLESGAYYEMEIVSDGSQELALTGPEFFRAIWMDEIVINDLEIRPLAIDSVEFDDEGTIEISFVAIKPGKYYLKVPGTDAAAQRVDITIK